MFQYRVEDKIFESESLQIFNGVVKATSEDIEITTIKRDLYKYDADRLQIEKYLKSLRGTLTMIDIFPSKVFPTKTNGEWLVVIECKQHYNLTDFILNNVDSEDNDLCNIDILSLIYQLISTVLKFTNYSQYDSRPYSYLRLMPQNIFVSDYNEIFLKFPYWLLLDDGDGNEVGEDVMTKYGLNFSDSYRYYLPPHDLLLTEHDESEPDPFEIDDALYSEDIDSMLCHLDIWCLGCCIGEIFYGVPLFSSTNVADQFLKMFQILGAPDWRAIPWKYWNIQSAFKKSIEMHTAKGHGQDALHQIINNEAIVDLLRCCLQCTSSDQISLNQLSVFVDMFEINNKTENQQHRLTFKDIQSWNGGDNEDPQRSKESDFVMVGSSSLIEQWSLLSQKEENVEIEDNQQNKENDEIQENRGNEQNQRDQEVVTNSDQANPSKIKQNVVTIKNNEAPKPKTEDKGIQNEEEIKSPRNEEQKSSQTQTVYKITVKAPHEQKSSQTVTVQTTDCSINTEEMEIGKSKESPNNKTKKMQSEESSTIHSSAASEIKKIGDNLNITDCINILPFKHDITSINPGPLNVSTSSLRQCNLLILEFSQISGWNTMNTERMKKCSFQCRMDGTSTLLSSPIFNIDELKDSAESNKKKKVYIHVMLSADQRDDIANEQQRYMGIASVGALQIQMIAHNDAEQKQIGEFTIDITRLRNENAIADHYQVYSTSDFGKEADCAMGRVHVRVLPQFKISGKDSNQTMLSTISDCNTSTVTDENSVASFEAWNLFNTFIQHHE